MNSVNFLGRQMRHVKEGNKYVAMFSSGGAFIGVVGIYFELTWWQFLLVALPLSLFIAWLIGFESKKTKAKSARMSAEYRDVEYFQTAEVDRKKLIKLLEAMK